MRTIGLQNPICIVLDSINLPILEAGSAPAWRKEIPASAKILLYLGRLHAKKGLANLLHAWESLRTGRQPIGILWLSVGIREATKVSSSSWFVSEAWREFIFQVRCLADKHAAYAAADAFVLPSVSEDLPLVVLEAWSHGLPVVMRQACNPPEGLATGAALEIGSDIEGIRKGLDQVIHMSITHRRAMGDIGRLTSPERVVRLEC